MATLTGLFISWSGIDRAPEHPSIDRICSALSKASANYQPLAYRKAASASRSKEARYAYQAKRAAQDRADLKALKRDHPELYAQLLAQVRGS